MYELKTLSHNIAKRWRLGETRRSHGNWYFEFLSTRRETGIRQKTEQPGCRVLLCISGSEWENSCSNRKLIHTHTNYIYINREYRYILVWVLKSDIPTKSYPILNTFSSHTEYVKRESFSTFFICTIEYKTQTQKKSSEKELRHLAFYRTGTIIFTVLARKFLLFAWYFLVCCKNATKLQFRTAIFI